MTDQDTGLALLRAATGEPTARFRSGQWEAIAGVVDHREQLLVVERTGWGKSSVYFIATRILRDRGSGPTLIISPLLALMRNQVEAARRLGIRALTINSTNQSQWPVLKQAVRANQADALLISPEKLANDSFVAEVLLPISQSVGLLVVDEAHCISDWGHDFRPDYRRLSQILSRMPRNVPILATTATANDRVIADITDQLPGIRVQRGALTRTTLALQTLRLPTQAARLAWLRDRLPDLPGTGIVYTLTKRDANQVAAWLTQNGLPAKAYYSGVKDDRFADSNSYREHLEDLLLENKIKALVATTALGMGFDKPDLGFVVHYQAPNSVITYYQQVGRAGRGIDHAVGVLITGSEDDKIHDFFRRNAFPEEDRVHNILAELENSDGLTIRDLEARINLRHGQIRDVLKILSAESPAPVINRGMKWLRTPVPFRMDRERLVRLNKQRRAEWDQVMAYVDEGGCLMRSLALSLDDADPGPCGKCASCLGRPIISDSITPETVLVAERFLKEAEFPLDCMKEAAAGAFIDYPLNGKIPACWQAERGRILSRWGDAGWGQVVADQKHNGQFGDELVDVTANMIIRRWRPHPHPQWVTCIPSTNHPNLVPSFAARLAQRLGLPFIPALCKLRQNQPQKLQENRFRQCANLDGVFGVAGSIPAGPVLLVDDVIDSGWTLTVAAALLRHRGSGPVWPFALTTSDIGA